MLLPVSCSLQTYYRLEIHKLPTNTPQMRKKWRVGEHVNNVALQNGNAPALTSINRAHNVERDKFLVPRA